MRTKLLALLSLALSGCDPFEEDIRELNDCPPASPSAHLSGDWHLDGEGTRSECEEDHLNGAIDLRTARPLGITQDASGNLTLTTALGGFAFTGHVFGSCVEFVTDEGASGQVMNFSGNASGSRVAGTFRGEGPGSCVSTGTFTVQVVY